MQKVPVSLIIRLTPLIFFVPYALWLVNHRPDDVFIYYRYAQNIAAGFGIVFNQGEYVEGVTSLLWTGLLTLVIALKLPIEGYAPLLSLLSASILIWRLPVFFAKVQGRAYFTPIDLLSSLWVASLPSFAYWSYSGMETALFSLMLLLTIESFRVETKKCLYLSAVLVTLCVLIRPEMLAVIPAFLIFFTRFKKEKIPRILWWVTGVTLLISLIFIFRYFYFGELLPNTFYAKKGYPFEQTFSNGIIYLINFTGSLLPVSYAGDSFNILGASLFIALIYWGFKKENLALISAVSFFMIFAVIYDGGDWMILNRLLVPIAPLLAVLVLSLLDSKRIRVSIALASLSLMIFLNLLSAYRERFGIRGQLNPETFTTPPYSPFIDYINQHLDAGDSIALMDIGEIGFRTGIHVIDISGLVEPRIAKSPGGFLSKDYPVDWIFERNPRWIALRNNWCLIDTRLSQSPQLARDYKEVLRVERPTPMILFERK